MSDPGDFYHRYERERARADDLADRDEFRGALVNSLQEGFFVTDATGCVVEINDAFADVTGYGQEGLPYPMPHPWAVDEAAAASRRAALVRDGKLTAEVRIRHRDGRMRWAAISVNAVPDHQSRRGVYVGTIRDVTAPRAAAERDRSMARLATAVSVAKNVDEVLAITLAHCRIPLDAQRLLAVMWPKTEGDEPTVRVAGEPAETSWADLDDDWRRTFEDARMWIPLTVTPVGGAPSAGTTRGFVAVLSGARDVVLCLEHRVPRVVSSEDRRLVAALVGHLSLAMQHVRQFESARETSLTLQRSLLAPIDLPPGFAVRYEPAVHPLEIGGDFYDVIPVGEDRIGLVVGDCVGRGLAAAAVMGQLRASTRALLLTGAQPSALLEHLDSVAEHIPDAFCTTVFVAIIDTESATVQYSSAGHVPPVLVSDTGPPQLLDGAGSVPLAVKHPEPRPQASHPLAPGSTLMLYTDGLVERRDHSIDAQIDRLAAVVADTTNLQIEEVADAVLGRLAPDSGYDDDVAIVLYRSARAALVIDDTATASKLTEVRHRLAAWLAASGASDSSVADLILVVNEACSNSVEHAYRGRDPGRMRVDAKIHDTQVHVCVTDFGSWKAPPVDPGTRGRGLLLMRAVSDRVDLDGTAAGTTVDMTFQLPELRL
ncbi:stage II sporulation protein E [Mycolicibacterium sp. GF69]|uniref:SpoIIE family protein phosphatase n=1 Tax=Mycolicibacterium sp. GF69 TaxID=2267251 RepID=UPI000DCCE740|nr:SpoIIE family protein phosphatase [Mycolicibacterium sp. GF69]RAV18271.1 stage II sporulation protein E [Mycolicibacterium sp. GF69]